jgi:adenosylmethionine-8-amino-7-oxononanoate aminotransferase
MCNVTEWRQAMTQVIHRDLHQQYSVAVRGDGVYVTDANGKRYIDASGSAAVACLGYNDSEALAAVRAQLDTLCFIHSSFFTTRPMEELATDLVRDEPGGLSYVCFVSGGSEAIEAALKLALQYFVETDQPRRTMFIARAPSYHGDTAGAMSIGHRPANRRRFAPLMFRTEHVSPCYAYRHKGDGESDEQYSDRLASELRQKIEELGPERIAAFVADTVSGSALGAVPPVHGYFKRIREICDEFGILLILDEVMCGMGRCGSRYAFAQEGIGPDILAIAKGLGAGYQPIGAALCSDRIYQAIAAGSGAFFYGQTFMGHATSCAAALAVQQIVRRRGLLRRVNELGSKLESALRDCFAGHPNVGDIRGRGLLWGVELVADRATKQPFPVSAKVSARLKEKAMAAGLLCNAYSGCVDGVTGDHLVLAPAFILQEEHISEIVSLLQRAVEDTLPHPSS